MPVPNRPIYIKKLAGGVAYYSGPPLVPPTPEDIVRQTNNSCEYPSGGTCTSVNSYLGTYSSTTPTNTVVWSVSPGATIVSGQGTTVVGVETTGNADVTFNLTMKVTDENGTSSQLTKTFTDVKTLEPPITITDFYYSASGNSCEFPSGGTCSATGTILSAIANATGTVTYNWSATNGVTFDDNTVANPTTNSPASDTNLTFDVTLTVTDSNSTATSTKTFTDTKTQQPFLGIVKQNVVSFVVNNEFGNKTVPITLPTGTNRAIVVCIAKTASASGNVVGYGCTIGGQAHSLTRVSNDPSYVSYGVHFVFLEDKIAAMTNNNAIFTFAGSGQSASVNNSYSATVHTCSGVSSATQFASMTATGVVSGDALITSGGFNGSITWTNINGVLNSIMDVGDNFTAGNTADSVVSPVVSGTVTTGSGGAYPITTRLIAVVP